MNELYFRHIRYDYILIWGHGLPHKDKILDSIAEHPSFTIEKIITRKVQKIEDLVNAVYSYDYAPIEHLKAKIQYLFDTPNEVVFVFFRNIQPDEDFFGTGKFRHIESRTLKSFKERIRSEYNPRKDGKKTENHVIHASDNQQQTDYILQYLGFKGLEIFSEHQNIINAPHYIDCSHGFTLCQIALDNLECNIVVGSRYEFSTKRVNIEETPHYRALTGDWSVYQNYLDTYWGTALTQYYSVKKFKTLFAKFSLDDSYRDLNFIIVRRDGDKYVVLDGLHRVCVLKIRNVKSSVMVVV